MFSTFYLIKDDGIFALWRPYPQNSPQDCFFAVQQTRKPCLLAPYSNPVKQKKDSPKTILFYGRSDGI